MKTKTKVIIVVGLAALVGGIGYYFWKKASVTEPIVTKNDLFDRGKSTPTKGKENIPMQKVDLNILK